MGFLDFLTGKNKCPRCGTPGATIEGSQVRCLNPTCEWFDQSLLRGLSGGQTQAPPPASPVMRGTASGSVAAGLGSGRTVTIRYRNFRGQDLTFTADAESGRRKKNHISVRVLPTGQRVTLSRARIQNLRELDENLPQRVAPGQQWPTPRERQVLGYHKKHGTTSPLYEKVRAKYPDW